MSLIRGFAAVDSYNVVNGRIYVGGAINVTWQLSDVTTQDGGFCVGERHTIRVR